MNLLTTLGPLDLLGEIGRNHLDYEKLLPHSNTLAIGDGKQIRVLNLETLIELKEELAGQKDLAMLDILKQTLKEARKKQP